LIDSFFIPKAKFYAIIQILEKADGIREIIPSQFLIFLSVILFEISRTYLQAPLIIEFNNNLGLMSVKNRPKFYAN